MKEIHVTYLWKFLTPVQDVQPAHKASGFPPLSENLVTATWRSFHSRSKYSVYEAGPYRFYAE